MIQLGHIWIPVETGLWRVQIDAVYPIAYIGFYKPDVREDVVWSVRIYRVGVAPERRGVLPMFTPGSECFFIGLEIEVRVE